MQITRNMPSYDPRAASSAAMNRAIMAPHYIAINNYQTATSESLLPSQPVQSHHHQIPFQYTSFATSSPVQLDPAFPANFITRGTSFVQTSETATRPPQYRNQPRTTYVDAPQPISIIKPEDRQSPQEQSPSYTYGSRKASPSNESAVNETAGKTDIDNLVKVIQVKTESSSSPTGSSKSVVQAVVPNCPDQDEDTMKELAKKHKCHMCDKRFAQKTHLDIHIRSHTGAKPYVSQRRPLHVDATNECLGM